MPLYAATRFCPARGLRFSLRGPRGKPLTVFLSHGRSLSAIRGPDTCSRVSEIPSCGSRGMPEFEMGVLEQERRTLLIFRTGSAIVHALVVRFPGPGILAVRCPFWGAFGAREIPQTPSGGARGRVWGATTDEVVKDPVRHRKA